MSAKVEKKEDLSDLELALQEIEGMEEGQKEKPTAAKKVTVASKSSTDDLDELDKLADTLLSEESNTIDEATLDDVTKTLALEEEVEKSYASLEPEKSKVSPAKSEPETESKADPQATAPDSTAATSGKSKRAVVAHAPASETLRKKVPAWEESVTHMLSAKEQKADKKMLNNFIEAKLRHIDDAPVKVGEKIVNTCAVINQGGNLQIYTRLALEMLAKHGTVTQAELKKMYLENPARPYTEGTANAQSGQMTHLFPILGIASAQGKILTLNKDSVIFEELDKIFHFTDKKSA